ncbi:hypothetical protein QVD17_08818 [Tagetes erecta]|uniref:Uncharacterized protein n=1 Tax=Tagetes erecta TaxID=13708 RepID=A0AAD8L0I0_TARER|nr:hypothetical protein QVD17_08818 [Tagetes erecta]
MECANKYNAECLWCGTHRSEVSHEVSFVVVIYRPGISQDVSTDLKHLKIFQKIIDREDDYRRRRLNQVISPERHDAFAHIVKILNLKQKERSSFFSNEFQSVAKTLKEREQNMKEKFFKLKIKSEDENLYLISKNLKYKNELKKNKQYEIDAMKTRKAEFD